MTDNLDDILNEIAQNKHKWHEENPSEQVKEEREKKVAAFHLDMDLDGEFGEYTPAPQEEKDDLSTTRVIGEKPAPVPMATAEIFPKTPVADEAETPSDKWTYVEKTPTKPAKKRRSKMDARTREVWGCAGSVFYVLFILGISLLMACVIIVAALDLTGLNKSGMEVKVTIEEGATASSVADALFEKDLINQKWFFKLYSRVTGDDSEFRSGIYTFSANMGYGNIVDRIRAGVPRSIVSVTIPEGYTIDGIAQLMEDNAVCTKKAFYDAVLNGDYTDYAFVAAIPKEEGRYAGRGYALEGYLFPDTYDFYTGSTGESVVRKLLNNFDNRVDTSYKTKIAAYGMTVNEVITLASIVQAEAAGDEWSQVSRVLTNRLNNAASYPHLECDATLNYYNNLDLTVQGLTISKDDYNTKVRTGLTPGAVCNPGMKAIDAVISPSVDAAVAKCYFFATDESTGITYYSQTYAQHLAICQKYNIGGGGSNAENE